MRNKATKVGPMDSLVENKTHLASQQLNMAPSSCLMT